MTDGVWVSLTEAAGIKGVSKQAISKRLERLSGRVATRREGQRLLFNLAEYDRVTGAETDPAQALRNRAAAGEEPAARKPGETAQLAFSVHRAKRENYEAELARLKLDEQLGKLVPVADVEAAMVRCAERLVRGLDQIPALSDDPQARLALKGKVRELRQVLADEMKLMAREGETEEQAG